MKTDQPKPTGEWTSQTAYDLYRKGDGGFNAVADAHNAALAAKDHEWNLARLTDIKELTDKHAQQLAAERKLLYRIGRRMMESQATGEPLNLDLLRREIDAVLYPAQKPERFA